MRAYVLFGAAVALACGASVQAASLTDFNVIVTGSASINGHVDGTIAIGGNLTAISSPVFNNSLTVGGTISGPYHLNSGTLTQGSFATSTYAGLMQGWSSYYQSLATDSSISMNGNPTFAATPGADKVAVFSVNASILSNSTYQNGWLFSGLASDVTVVINVDASNSNHSVVINQGNFNSTGYTGKIIWNFYNAETINMTDMKGTFEGTVLAPNADLTISGKHINGNVYVDNLNTSGGSELHLYPFTGQPPVGQPPIPEPATVGLLLPFAAGMLLRRSKRQ